jgi:NADH-quinone oxidoreductase subunit G
MSVRDFGTIDRALVIGSFLRKDQPLLAQRLRQIAKRGARVWSLHAVADDWLMPMAGQVVIAPSQWLSVLAQIAAGVAAAKSLSAPLEAEPNDVTQRLAADLVSGRHRAVILGSSAQSHPNATQIWALAEWIANAVGAKLVVLPEAANSVGAHLVGAVSNVAGSSVRGQFKAKKRAYLVFNCEPEFDSADPALALEALRGADMVAMFSPFASAGASYADVQLPISPFTETSGTFVNCEAVMQSFYGTVSPLGETRPGWKVLRVLGNLLGLEGFDYESSDQILAEIKGTLGDLAPHLGNQSGVSIDALAPSSEAIERVADVPIHFADSLVRRAPALQRTSDAAPPELRINGKLALKLKLANGTLARVTQGAGTADLITRIDPDVADETVRIASSHALTAALGPMIGPVAIEVLQHVGEPA